MEDLTLLSHVRIWKTKQIYNVKPRWYAEIAGCYGRTIEIEVDLGIDGVEFSSGFKDLDDWVKHYCDIFVINAVIEVNTIEEVTRSMLCVDRLSSNDECYCSEFSETN